MDWKAFVSEKVEEIQKAVGPEKVLSALSGGVDSSTATVLAHRAVPTQLKCLFLDDGLMREREGEKVVETFERLGIEVQLKEVKEEFFGALKGIEDPEDKRKAFRHAFYTCLGSAVKESGAKCLLQGTIAADIAETKGGIKTQHNILEQIGINPEERYGFKVIEPLRELYKDQVREVAKELSLPEEIHNKMPFPGPGLATRVLGEVTPDRVEVVRRATEIVEEEFAQLKPFQALAVLMKDKGTGLQEGKRAFGDVVIVRSVESKNALTASPTQVPWEILLRAGRRISEEIPSVVRVAYEITGKPPGTIEYI